MKIPTNERKPRCCYVVTQQRSARSFFSYLFSLLLNVKLYTLTLKNVIRIERNKKL